MKKAELTKHLRVSALQIDCGNQRKEETVFLVHAEIQKNGTVLQTDVYDGISGAPLYSVFATSEDFIMWEYDKQHWSEAMLRKRGFFESHYEWDKRERKNDAYLKREYRFDTEESILCGSRFFNWTGMDTVHALARHQQFVRAAKLEISHRAKRKAIDRVMDQARPLPATFQAWVDRVPLQNSRYIYYKRQGKQARGYCTVCDADVIIPAGQARHNQPGICPHCHQKITFKATGISKHIQDFVRVEYVQRVDGNSLMIREFDITKEYGEDYRHPEYFQYEGSRHIIHPDGSREKYLPNGCIYDWLGDWKKRSSSDEFFAWLYTPNLHVVLKGTPWQYSGIADYAKKTRAFAATWYFADCLKRPCLEYLAKMGFLKLLDERYAQSYFYGNAVNWDGKTLRDVLKIRKGLIRLAVQKNVSSEELHVLQLVTDAGISAEPENLEWLTQNDLYPHKDEIVYLLRHMTFWKIRKYSGKVAGYNGRCSTGDIIGDWCDYLHNADLLGYDLSKNATLFPKDLKKAHDKAMKLVKVKKDSVVDAKLRNLCKELSSLYGFRDSDYIVRAPSCLKDLLIEGERQQNCVAGYAPRVARQETVVLFIRKADAPDEPFVTVEVRNGHVVQVRGYGNSTPQQPVLDFVEAWKRKVLEHPERRRA